MVTAGTAPLHRLAEYVNLAKVLMCRGTTSASAHRQLAVLPWIALRAARTREWSWDVRSGLWVLRVPCRCAGSCWLEGCSLTHG